MAPNKFFNSFADKIAEARMGSLDIRRFRTRVLYSSVGFLLGSLAAMSIGSAATGSTLVTTGTSALENSKEVLPPKIVVSKKTYRARNGKLVTVKKVSKTTYRRMNPSEKIAQAGSRLVGSSNKPLVFASAAGPVATTSSAAQPTAPKGPFLSSASKLESTKPAEIKTTAGNFKPSQAAKNAELQPPSGKLMASNSANSISAGSLGGSTVMASAPAKPSPNLGPFNLWMHFGRNTDLEMKDNNSNLSFFYIVGVVDYTLNPKVQFRFLFEHLHNSEFSKFRSVNLYAQFPKVATIGDWYEFMPRVKYQAPSDEGDRENGFQGGAGLILRNDFYPSRKHARYRLDLQVEKSFFARETNANGGSNDDYYWLADNRLDITIIPQVKFNFGYLYAQVYDLTGFPTAVAGHFQEFESVLGNNFSIGFGHYYGAQNFVALQVSETAHSAVLPLTSKEESQLYFFFRAFI